MSRQPDLSSAEIQEGSPGRGEATAGVREVTLRQLLRFYIACIEAEDNRASRKKVTSLHHSVISPWDKEEVLFNRGVGSVEFETTYKSERSLLTRGPALAGEPERFFYGFPLLLYREQSEWYISALFVQEVDVLQKGAEGHYTVQPVDAEDVQVNRQLFQRLHIQPEELTSITKELESPFDSFAARLQAAFQLMAVPVPTTNPTCLDPWPRQPLRDDSWVNRPILFKSEQSPYTFHLRRELEQLASDVAIEAKVRGTALGTYLGRCDGAPTVAGPGIPLLPVMPLNRGQEEAARSSLAETLTVVTGPPDTGKSQVVVNLLASYAAAGKSVLFASKNNKAVDVVRERMNSLLGDSQDWVLRLGNRQMMDSCRTEMDGRLSAISALPPEQPPSPLTLQELDNRITRLRTELESIAGLQEELRELDRDRRVLEGLVVPAWVPSCADLRIAVETTDVWTRSKSRCAVLSNVRSRSLALWLCRRLLRRRTVRKFFRMLSSSTSLLPSAVRQAVPTVIDAGAEAFKELFDAFERLVHLARWRASEQAVSGKIAELARSPTCQALTFELEQQLARRSELSAQQFRVEWTKRLRRSTAHAGLSRYFDLCDRAFRSQGSGADQTAPQWGSQVQTLAKDLPVWVVTSLSVRRALPLSPALFDLLIMDEASQCDIPSALPLLYRARRALIIGDPQQLRHISTLPSDDETAIAAQHGLLDVVSTWSYNQRSLYGLSEEVASRRHQQTRFLAEHYRSHPEIIEFSNRRFYQGRLILRTMLPRLRERAPGHEMGVFWVDTPGAVARTPRSAVNEAEISAVVGLVGRWIAAGLVGKQAPSLGVVTPFRLQMEKLLEAIGNQSWPDAVKERIIVGTAHRFQGDECDIMVFSPVVSKGMSDHLVRWVATTDQLLNVAVTRARAALHVVGDMSACLAAGGSLGDFASSVQRGIRVADESQLTETPPEQEVAGMLTEMGLWHSCQYQVGAYRLDFLVVSPQGTRYDLEIDGRGHLTDEAVRADEARDAAVKAMGFRIVRIDARRVFTAPSDVKSILARL